MFKHATWIFILYVQDIPIAAILFISAALQYSEHGYPIRMIPKWPMSEQEGLTGHHYLWPMNYWTVTDWSCAKQTQACMPLIESDLDIAGVCVSVWLSYGLFYAMSQWAPPSSSTPSLSSPQPARLPLLSWGLLGGWRGLHCSVEYCCSMTSIIHIDSKLILAIQNQMLFLRTLLNFSLPTEHSNILLC